MPDGQMQWIDEEKGVAHLVRRGREYLADIHDVETAARVPGVRVHFDVTRSDGVEQANNVSLREGKRSNRRHRRFGDLAGARHAGAKVPTGSSGRLGVDVTTQPVRVVTAWLETLAAGELDDTLALYAADAEVHGPAGDVHGRSHVRGHLADEAPSGFAVDDVVMTGVDELVQIDWPAGVSFGAGPATGEPVSSFVLVDHGQIVEQWDRTDPGRGAEGEVEGEIVFAFEGHVSNGERDYLRNQFERLRAGIARPVRFTRVKVAKIEHGRHRERPVNASATIDLDGQVLRAHVGAVNVTEAADRLVDRLKRQLDSLADRENRRPDGMPSEPGSWRHGYLPTQRPDYFDRPVDDREIVRHKSYAPEESTVEEALWDLGSLDYDFFLFNEVASGQDCLIARQDDTVSLHSLDGAVGDDGCEAIDKVDASEAPTLSMREAVQRLDAGSEPWVFFRNRATERGNVAYRRYDGHYGVITPPEGS